MKKKKTFILVIAVLAITISKLTFIISDNTTFKRSINFISEEVNAAEKIRGKETLVEESLGDKKSQNEVATLTIPGTDYSTVVMQGNDNKFYLTHDENDNKHRGGVPFFGLSSRHRYI